MNKNSRFRQVVPERVGVLKNTVKWLRLTGRNVERV